MSSVVSKCMIFFFLTRKMLTNNISIHFFFTKHILHKAKQKLDLRLEIWSKHVQFSLVGTISLLIIAGLLLQDQKKIIDDQNDCKYLRVQKINQDKGSLTFVLESLDPSRIVDIINKIIISGTIGKSEINITLDSLDNRFLIYYRNEQLINLTILPYITGQFDGSLFCRKEKVADFSTWVGGKLPPNYTVSSIQRWGNDVGTLHNVCFRGKKLFAVTISPYSFKIPSFDLRTVNTLPNYSRVATSSFIVPKIYDENWKFLLFSLGQFIKIKKIITPYRGLTRSKALYNSAFANLTKTIVESDMPKCYQMIAYTNPEVKGLPFNRKYISSYLKLDFSILDLNQNAQLNRSRVAITNDLKNYLQYLAHLFPNYEFIVIDPESEILQLQGILSKVGVLICTHFEHALLSLFLPQRSVVLDLQEARNYSIPEVEQFVKKQKLFYIKPDIAEYVTCNSFHCLLEDDRTPIRINRVTISDAFQKVINMPAI